MDRKSGWLRFKNQLAVQVFIWIGLVFLIVFRIIPMFGVILAFKHYSISSGISGIFTSPWAGLDHFIEFFTDYRFFNLLRNTLVLSFLKLLFSFPAPILLAIMINEIRHSFLKRFVQTVTYLPHFVSWVIIVGISSAFFSQDGGIVNTVLMQLHLIREPIAFLTAPGNFWGLATFTAVWKETGWWTIIFLAAITGIDQALYEAAEIDGAGRLQRIWHITLPGMRGAIATVLILSIGSFLGGGMVGSNFEQSYLQGNIMNNATAEIIQTYAFKNGLLNGRFDYATAIEFFQSVISVLLIFVSNWFTKKKTGVGLY